MNKLLNEITLKIVENTELVDCLADVLENAIAKNEKPYHALSLIYVIQNKSKKILQMTDEMPIHC